MIEREDRICFLNDRFHKIEVPQFQFLNGRPLPVGTVEDKTVNREGFMAILTDVCEQVNIPPFEAKQTYPGFKRVCPESLVDPYLSHMAIIESACAKYHWTVDEVMETEDAILEVFNELTAGENDYDRIKKSIADKQVKDASVGQKHKMRR